MTTLRRQTHAKTIRDKHLVFLAYHIKAATNRYRYKEIAKLVGCVRDQNDYSAVHLENSLNKIVRRQEQTHPEFFQAAKEAVKRDYRNWRYFFRPLTKFGL